MGSSARGRAHGYASLRIVIYHAVVVVPDSKSNNFIALIYIRGEAWGKEPTTEVESSLN